MANPTISAIVIESGEHITVYRHHKSGYVDFADCKTKYKKSELVISKK